jgi:hypothetical protein
MDDAMVLVWNDFDSWSRITFVLTSYMCLTIRPHNAELRELAEPSSSAAKFRRPL